MEPDSQPLIAIVGQTASGKSDIAMALAQKYKGEIIAADSRTIYKGMDIGTAKPSIADQAKIPHHGLDLIYPDQTYSAAEFKRYAGNAIKQIHERHNIPFIVGGTGLYVDGLLYDFEFGNHADNNLRLELDELNLDDLQARAKKLGINETDIDFKNRRHLSRAIERGGMIRNRFPLSKSTLILGLDIEKSTLDLRIETRVGAMIARGFDVEASALAKAYGPNAPGLMSPGYASYIDFMQGKTTFDEMVQGFVQRDKRLAKKQKTWFKRNKDIIWVRNFTEADKVVKNFLSKFATIHP